jgi:hypothetical protein
MSGMHMRDAALRATHNRLLSLEGPGIPDATSFFFLFKNGDDGESDMLRWA